MNKLIQTLQDQFHSPLARATLAGDREAVQNALQTASPFATEEGITALELAAGLFGRNRAIYADQAAQRYGEVIELLLAAMRATKADYIASIDAEDRTIAQDGASIAALSHAERYKNLQRLAYVRARASQTDPYAALLVKANDLSAGHSHPALREELARLAAQDESVWEENLELQHRGETRTAVRTGKLNIGGARHHLRIRKVARTQEQAA